jgi:hypothetical protein
VLAGFYIKSNTEYTLGHYRVTNIYWNEYRRLLLSLHNIIALSVYPSL